MKLILMRSVKTMSLTTALQSSLSSTSLEGRQHAQQVAKMLSSVNMIPTKIITSSIIRAKETGQEVANCFDKKISVLASANIIPGCSSSDLLKTVMNNSEDHQNDVIMAVIHQPDMRIILGNLLFDDGRFQFRILSGDVCLLDIEFNDTDIIVRLFGYFSPCLQNQKNINENP